MDIPERVARLPWFAGLSAPVRRALIARGRLRKRGAGEWLYGEGDEDTGVVAVLDGGLYLHATAGDGDEVLFNMLPAGGVMGQSILLGGGPRLVTAICAVESQLFLVPDRALQAVAAQHPTLWASLAALSYGQLRDTLRRVTEFVGLKPRERLVARLIALSALSPHIPLTQTALAEMIGASRVAVNRWLGELEAKGAIARGYGVIDVRDARALRRMLS